MQWFKSLFIALIIALFIRTFFVRAYKIPTASMEPTLWGAENAEYNLPFGLKIRIGDHLLANIFIFGIMLPYSDIRLPTKLRDIRRGEIIIFKYPKDPSKDYVKRVIGLPGEIIEIRNKQVYINGEPLEEPWLKYPEGTVEKYRSTKIIFPKEHSPRDNLPPMLIPKDSYFVMGDNRDSSSDSRFWGCVHFKYIRGIPLIIYFPPNRIRFIE